MTIVHLCCCPHVFIQFDSDEDTVVFEQWSVKVRPEYILLLQYFHICNFHCGYFAGVISTWPGYPNSAKCDGVFMQTQDFRDTQLFVHVLLVVEIIEITHF